MDFLPAGPIFNRLLLKHVLLSIKKQDTSHKLYMWHSILAGNMIGSKHNNDVLSYFWCFNSSMKLGPGWSGF